MQHQPLDGLAEIAEPEPNGSAKPKRPRKSKAPNTNPSGIHPTKFCVLVLPDKAEDTYQTASGIKIYKAIDTIDKEERASQTGTLIEVSPLAFCYEVWPKGSRKPQVGDKVIFAKYAGFLRRGKNTAEYRIMEDKDVLATVD